MQIFYKRPATSDGAIKNDIMSDQKLAETLHKPVIKRFKKYKVYSSYYVINYYVIKHLILLGIQNTMDINVDFLQTYYINFL